MRAWDNCPQRVRDLASSYMGTVLVGVLTGFVFAWIPVSDAPALAKGAVGFFLAVAVASVIPIWHWKQNQKTPRWDFPRIALSPQPQHQAGGPHFYGDGRFGMMFWINIGSFDVQEAPLEIERAFLEWVNYPLLHRGRLLHRVPCESVDHGGSSATLPIRLYPLIDGDSRTFMFSTLITPRVHENAPKHSKLRLYMNIGGHARKKDIAQLKMRETWSAAEISYLL